MRLTRAAPADTTSSRTPPISRAVAPLMGASKASCFLAALRAAGGFAAVRADLFATDLRAGFRAGFFTALRAFDFFAFFAMRELVARNKVPWVPGVPLVPE